MAMEKGMERNENTVSTRVMELVVSGLLMAVAVLVMWDNWLLGAQWGEFGPETGYFPFRIGAILFISSGVTFLVNVFTKNPNLDNFVDRSQFKAVLQVLIPSIVFVVAIGYLGIYVSGALYIAFFMWWLGKYPIYKIVPTAIVIPLVLFVLFEIWFLVPMPKGPLEAALGY